MDLDGMLHVDRYRDIDELSPIQIIVRMPEPDCFLRYRISTGTWNFTSGKFDVYVLTYWPLQRRVVWFYNGFIH